MIGIGNIPELHRWSSSRDLYFHLVKKDIAASYSRTQSHTETGIGLERKIKHEINIQVATNSCCYDRIRFVGPAIITYLDHKMIIGPAGNFASLPDAAKWILSVGMLLGRLEIITVFVLCIPAFWRH